MTFSPSSIGASDFPNEEEEAKAQRKVQGIVKTAQGQFLNVVLSKDGDSFYLTITDRLRRSHKLCDNFAIPTSFIQQIDLSGQD